jgi:hypothetical protein
MRETCPWCKQPWDDDHREEAWIGEGWTWPVNFVYCPKFPRGRPPGPYGGPIDVAAEELRILVTAVEVTAKLSGGNPSAKDMEWLRTQARAAKYNARHQMHRWPSGGKGIH